jgi:hypothetical protein
VFIGISLLDIRSTNLLWCIKKGKGKGKGN